MRRLHAIICIYPHTLQPCNLRELEQVRQRQTATARLTAKREVNYREGHQKRQRGEGDKFAQRFAQSRSTIDHCYVLFMYVGTIMHVVPYDCNRAV